MYKAKIVLHEWTLYIFVPIQKYNRWVVIKSREESNVLIKLTHFQKAETV
jgi:hypothetical protein